MSKVRRYILPGSKNIMFTQVWKDYISKLTGWGIPMLVSLGDLYIVVGLTSLKYPTLVSLEDLH